MSCIRQLWSVSCRRATWSVYECRQKTRRSDAASMATRSVPGLGRHMPWHVHIASLAGRQSRGWLCRCNNWSQRHSKVQRHHLRCWLFAGDNGYVGRQGKARSWPRQRDWSSNRRLSFANASRWRWRSSVRGSTASKPMKPMASRTKLNNIIH